MNAIAKATEVQDKHYKTAAVTKCKILVFYTCIIIICRVQAWWHVHVFLHSSVDFYSHCKGCKKEDGKEGGSKTEIVDE